MKRRIWLSVLLALVIGTALFFLVGSSEAGDGGCCGDKALLAAGVVKAHSALVEGDPDTAQELLERVAELTEIELDY